MRPRVSILTASYQHSRFISDAIASVLNQSFTDWELIIVDDRSADDSVAVAKSFDDPRISVEVNPVNLGTYGTQQRALERASGSLVAVLNSDDVWAPEKLEAQVEALDRHPDASACFALGWMCTVDGQVDASIDVHVPWPIEPVGRPLPYILTENRILASSVLFRREGLRFEPSLRYCGDWVALLEAIQRGPLVCLPQRLSFWRQHPANSYLMKPALAMEEIRVRKSIYNIPPKRWVDLGCPAAEVRRRRGELAQSIAALYVAFGKVRDARPWFLAALTNGTKPKTATKRFFASYLPEQKLRQRLWPGYSERFEWNDSGNQTKVQFHLSHSV